MTMMILYKLALLLSVLTTGVDAHGFLKSPRSRNFIAYQDGATYGNNPNQYPKDYCPHCINRKEPLGHCGTNGDQNYDAPKSTAGSIMPADPQMVVSRGDQITVEVGLTAHHMGHFVFSADGIALDLVEDVFYGSFPDPNNPKRAYIPPASLPTLVTDSSVGIAASLYQYKLQLPADLVGDVLLQWHYLTANSCTFDGYDTYNFPADWGNMGSNLVLCPDPLPADGNGAPEQFWNCAEITITDGPVAPTTSEAPINMAPPVPMAPTEAPAPAPTSGEPCGDGNVNNGICEDPEICCSEWGWCGTSSSHCSNTPVPQTPEPVSPAPISSAPVPPVTSSPTSTAPVVNPSPSTPDNDYELIWGEGFEDGFGKFKQTGNKKNSALKENQKHSGDWSAQLRKKGGSSKIQTVMELVSGYSDLEINFWYRGAGMADGESFEVQVRFSGAGQNWITLQEYTYDIDFTNNKWEESTVNVTPAGMRVRIRFVCKANTKKGKVFLDDIVFSGLPLVSPTEAPINMAPPVPVTPTGAPVVLPVTLAPIITTPTPAPILDVDDWVISTEPRCGNNDADARNNCGDICSYNGDCAEGTCWVVHANYCGSKPEPNPTCNTPAFGNRCGPSELLARETCGPPCNDASDCAVVGDSCFPLHSNLCHCL